MPKIVTEQDKESAKDLMIEKTTELIKSKGLKKVTVGEIVKSCGIATGSFYLYYNSKEELLYDLWKRSEQQTFERIEALKDSSFSRKEKVIKGLHEIYLAS